MAKGKGLAASGLLRRGRPTIQFMDDRGWGWTASEIRQNRLVEWSADTYVPVKPFYAEQAGQDALTHPWCTASYMVSRNAP